MPPMLTGGSLEWGWKNDKIVAVSILRERTILPGRNYINRGEGYIKFRRHTDMIEWIRVFDRTVLRGSDGRMAMLRISRSKRDLICYHPRFSSPTYMRVYDNVWDILKREVEEVVKDMSVAEEYR